MSRLRPGWQALGYRPYEAVEELPHVMVDGSARRTSVLTLSHWPGSPTPRWLARDLSAEIVLDFLRYGSGRVPPPRREARGLDRLIEAAGRAVAVTNDHFDEDGLVSVLALTDPERALSQAEQLVGVAACGDFSTVRSERAAMSSFAIGPLSEQLAGAAASTSERYSAVLPVAWELMEHPERFEPSWRPAMELLDVGRAAIGRGEVEIDEVGDDCAVVRRDLAGRRRPDRLAGASGGLPACEAALFTATPSSRVLAFDGDRCELVLRYEGWVRFVSRPIRRRPDLAPLAASLSALEPGGAVWTADAPGAIVCRLRPSVDCVTELGEATVTRVVTEYLRTAPVAFDPFGA